MDRPSIATKRTIAQYLAGLTFSIAAFLPSAIVAADSGPPADVAEVRAAEMAAWPGSGPVKIVNVHVLSSWAVLEWTSGMSGGMSAYHRTAFGTWKRFMHGGGAFSASDLEKNGCPASIARELVPGAPG